MKPNRWTLVCAGLVILLGLVSGVIPSAWTVALAAAVTAFGLTLAWRAGRKS